MEYGIADDILIYLFSLFSVHLWYAVSSLYIFMMYAYMIRYGCS